MYHVIAAFLWASSGIVVDVDVDATCSKFNDMFFFFSFCRPILFEALCMVCKFFTWPHFCILCGNTLEASAGRLGSYPVGCQNNKMLATDGRQTTKSVKKPFSWRLINWLDSRTQQALTLHTQLLLPLLVLLLPLPLSLPLADWLADCGI